jgi:hypothetical protein
MIKMNDEITVIRDDSVIKYQSSDAAPIPKGATLQNWRTPRGTFVRHFDAKG